MVQPDPVKKIQPDTSEDIYKCRCGRLIGRLVPHHKYPDLYSLDLGGGNLAETFHGRCGTCGAGVHFEWRWELAAKVFKSEIHLIIH